MSEICIHFWDIFRLSCPKFEYIFRTISMPTRTANLKDEVSRRIASKKPFAVWTPTDFLDLGSREAVDKTLQRLARSGELRRIDRGLYDKPALNSLTKKPTTPDYRELINVVSRRDQSRMLIDGMTAANDLGLTDAVPARVVVRTDARLRPLRLDNLTIEFKLTAPSKLYWAGHPAMRVVQALHWLKDMLPGDRDRITKRLQAILHHPETGAAIRADLRSGLSTLPIWMQRIVRDLLDMKNSNEKVK
jgi:Family of unknown function (DUF6088)